MLLVYPFDDIGGRGWQEDGLLSAKQEKCATASGDAVP